MWLAICHHECGCDRRGQSQTLLSTGFRSGLFGGHSIDETNCGVSRDNGHTAVRKQSVTVVQTRHNRTTAGMQ